MRVTLVVKPGRLEFVWRVCHGWFGWEHNLRTLGVLQVGKSSVDVSRVSVFSHVLFRRDCYYREDVPKVLLFLVQYRFRFTPPVLFPHSMHILHSAYHLIDTWQLLHAFRLRPLRNSEERLYKPPTLIGSFSPDPQCNHLKLEFNLQRPFQKCN